MPGLFDDWYDQRVQVKTLTGEDHLGAQTTVLNKDVPVWYEPAGTLVRTALGSETRQTGVLFAALGDREKFTPGSQVELPDGNTATVAAVAGADAGSDDDLDGITVTLS